MPIELPPVVGEDGVGALHSVVDVLEDFHLDPLAAEEGDGGLELPQGGGAVRQINERRAHVRVAHRQAPVYMWKTQRLG